MVVWLLMVCGSIVIKRPVDTAVTGQTAQHRRALWPAGVLSLIADRHFWAMGYRRAWPIDF
jgi:hypothetical protein